MLPDEDREDIEIGLASLQGLVSVAEPGQGQLRSHLRNVHRILGAQADRNELLRDARERIATLLQSLQHPS